MAACACAETRASTTTRTSPASPLDLWPPAPYNPTHHTSATPQTALLIEVRHFYHDAEQYVDLISELVDPVVKVGQLRLDLIDPALERHGMRGVEPPPRYDPKT